MHAVKAVDPVAAFTASARHGFIGRSEVGLRWDVYTIIKTYIENIFLRIS